MKYAFGGTIFPKRENQKARSTHTMAKKKAAKKKVVKKKSKGKK
jgi:hypothetical protein